MYTSSVTGKTNYRSMVKNFKLELSVRSFNLCCSDKIFPAATTCVLSDPCNSETFETHQHNFPSPPPSSPISKRHVINEAIFARRNTPTCVSISSANSDWFSGECELNGDDDDDEESGSLLQSSSLDSSYDFGYPLDSIYNNSSVVENRTKRMGVTLQRLKSLFKSCRGEETDTVVACAPNYKSPSTKVLPKKVNESYAVVKRSDDPYEDFKNSMLEMIFEKEIFDPKDLEQLLHCFLSLNSRRHQRVIIQAFSEIWKELFDV